MKQLDFFAFFIRDENEKIVGGCGGDTMYDSRSPEFLLCAY